MILSSHQPAYLPWLGYFEKILHSDQFLYLDTVQFEKDSFINRNKIKAHSGEQWLTVPVRSQGHLEKNICDLEIDNTKNWSVKHWKSIQLKYIKAPFYKTYAPFFEDTYNRQWELLTELNFYMLEWFLKILKITTPIVKAKAHTFKGEKSDLVLDMCLQLKAAVFIFGAMGKDYADINKFKAAGVLPVFQDYKHPKYNQLYGDFLPYMSIIDLLFNEGPDSLAILNSSGLNKKEYIESMLKQTSIELK